MNSLAFGGSTESLALANLLDEHREHVGRDGLITPSLLTIVFAV
jgi:hypothetical protein